MSIKNFKRLYETLSLEEQKLVIMAYRDYKIVVQGVSELFFGADFQEKLDIATTKQDRAAAGMLCAGLREVFQIVITIQKHKDAYPTEFNLFFKNNLPSHVFEKLYCEASVKP